MRRRKGSIILRFIKMAESGVYEFYDCIMERLYVGQSKDLRTRFYNHFITHDSLPKGDYAKVKYIRYAIIENATDRDIYETYLINKYQPEFNISKKHLVAPSIELPELEFSRYFKVEEIIALYNRKDKRKSEEKKRVILQKEARSVNDLDPAVQAFLLQKEGAVLSKEEQKSLVNMLYLTDDYGRLQKSISIISAHLQKNYGYYIESKSLRVGGIPCRRWICNKQAS